MQTSEFRCEYKQNDYENYLDDDLCAFNFSEA